MPMFDQGRSVVGRPPAFERCYFWLLSPLSLPGPPPVPAVESLGSGVVVVVEDVSVDVVPEVSGAGSSAKARVALANERPAQAISESTSLRSMFPSVLTSHYDA